MPTFTYVSGDSVLHRCDARLKITLLFAFTVALFFVHTWWGMAAFAAAVVAALIVGRIPLRNILAPLVPVIVLAVFAVVFAALNASDAGGVLNGLLLGVRMVVMVAASLVVCMTTTSTELLDAFSCIIGPLRRVRVPVDDIAFTLALALRFIPVIAEEFVFVRNAQLARGADLDGVSFTRKLQLVGAAFSAVFIGMFRRADALATAMDARCYGASSVRTRFGD